MPFTLKKSPTITGGTDYVFTASGYNGSRYQYLGQSNSHLTPTRLELAIGKPVDSKNGPGTASSQTKITVGSRVVEEGCCTASNGTVVVDLKVRWNLMQPESQLDDAIALARAWVQSPQFVNSIKAGFMPT